MLANPQKNCDVVKSYFVDEEYETDDDAFYTTIFMNDDGTVADQQTTNSQVEDVSDPDPYITFSDMQSLSDSTYSLRHSLHEANGEMQSDGDLYDALDQSR